MIQTSARPAMRRATRYNQFLARQLKAAAKRPNREPILKEPLNKRQKARELSGFYDSAMPLAHILKQRFGHFGRQIDDATGKLVRIV